MAADHGGERPLIRAVRSDDVRSLRHRVLRPGQAFVETAYPGDDDPGTVHLAAHDGERLVGIASLYPEARTGAPDDGWRLRGMAVEPEAQGRGLGLALLDASVDHAISAGGSEVWCNSRTSAIGFYRRAGFEIVGGEFEVPGIGIHVVMVRPLLRPGT